MIQKIYITKGINADDADFAIPEGQAKNLVNIRYGSTDGGRTQWLENIRSTIEIPYDLPTGTNQCIGSAVDESNNRLVWLNMNSDGNHAIYCLDGNTVYTVLTSSQAPLNFTTQAQVKISDSLLFWTDNTEEPKRINYESGIKLNHPTFQTSAKAYTAPVNIAVTRLIRRPPAYPIVATKKNDSDTTINFIKYEAMQFMYRYTFKDGETSTFSAHSNLINYGRESDIWNYVELVIPTDERIDQDVTSVEVAVKYLSTNKTFIIKTFTDFTAHNSGNPLTYKFYNSQIGLTVDDAAAVKPYDSVPIKSKTIEVAKNRIFLGNNLEGYDSPTVAPSFSGDFSIPGGGSNITGRWFNFTFETLGGIGTKYFIYISGIGNDSGYYSDPSVEDNQGGPNTSLVFPANVDYNVIRFHFEGADEMTIFKKYIVPYDLSKVKNFGANGHTSVVLNSPTPEALQGTAIFKSDCSYQMGVVFLDHSQRKVLATSDDLTFKTPDRLATGISNTTAFNWSLDNTNAAVEIPDWAEYYCIAITKALRTRYFIQGRASEMKYADKDASGNYTYTDTYAIDKAGIAINIKSLSSLNLGYVYNQGDIVKVYIGTNKWYLNIKDQTGDYIIVDLVDAGAFNSFTYAIFEIYTPHKSTEEFFYETGAMYPVNNPGTPDRTYSVSGGTLIGDVVILERNTNATQYSVEAMSPNDKFYKNWFVNVGRPIIKDKIGQQRKKYNISYSNVFANKRANGYSSFDALDEKELDSEFGQIQKLQLTSKTQEDGSVMLAICESETASIYLGETQLVAASGNSFVAVSPGIIGSVNSLRGSYGTNHPESVQAHKGLVFWWDEHNGSVVQYSANGLDEISKNKVERIFKEYGRKGTPGLCVGGIDPKHDEYLLCGPFNDADYANFPTLEAKNELDSFSTPKRTWRFAFAQNVWAGSTTVDPEHIAFAGMKAYSFKGGKLYLHNEGETYNILYGTAYPSIVSCVINGDPAKLKSYLALSLESNIAPSVYLYTKEPNEQISDIIPSEFRIKEGIFYAPILRDRLSPNVNADVTQKLLTGDRMLSPALNVQLNFDTTTKLEMKFLNVEYIYSKGHKI